MRSLRRPNVWLPTLCDGGAGASVMANYLWLKAADPNVDLDFSHAHWNNPDVRGALYAMQGMVCAYCNSYLPENDRGDVDHFRPKAPAPDGSHRGYWWITYWFGNYLLACSRCNRVLKRSRFPIEPGGVRAEHAGGATLDAEPRLLVDPSIDEPDRWLRVDWSDGLCPVVVSSNGGDPRMRRRFEESIAFFEINERPRLVRERRRALDEAMALYDEIDTKDDPEKREKLRRMACRYSPSGAAVRSLLEDLAPQVLPPSASEELGWLLEEVDERLLIAARCLERSGGSPVCEREAEELFWLLAVLWADPPAGTPGDLERWLDQKKWRAVVEPKVDALRSAARRAFTPLR